MARFTTILNNFSGGKVSDKFRGLSNTKIYQNSMEEFSNFFMGKIGGAYKRTGTVYTHDLTNLSADYTNTHTSIPFDTGSGTSYALFLPNTTIKLDGILDSDLYVIPNEDPGVLSGTQYGIGSGITIRVGSGLPAWPTANEVTFSGGAWIWQQVGDLLFLTHSSGEQRPLVLARTSDTTFDLNYFDSYQTETENLNLVLRVPYIKNLSSKTMAISGTTLTCSAAYFTADMIGSLVKINNGGTSEIAVITAYTNTTTVTVAYLIGSSTSAATDDWEISAWSDEFGWPTSVTYHQQRLFWGGSPSKYFDTIWASRVGNLFHMMRERLDQDTGATDSSGINYFGDIDIATDPTDFRPASTQSNAITWLSGGRVLMSGTSGGENLIKLGVEQIDIVENSNYGSSNSQVVKAGKDVIYVGKDGRSLRTYRYSEDNGSWLSDDLSSKADTLFLDGAIGASDFPTIKQMAWNPETKQLWVLLSDNRVKVLTYDPEYGLSGWSDFEIGGDDNKTILSVITLPSPDRSRYETYLAVERTKEAAATNIYFEKIMGEYNNTSMVSYSSTNIIDFPRFVDCAHLGTASAAGVLDARNPNVLGIFYDCVWMTATEVGYVYNIEVVLDGADVVLDYAFPADAKVITGYRYSAELKPMPLEAGGEVGPGISDLKDIDRVYLNLYRSKDLSIGSEDQRSGNDLNFEDIEYSDLTTEEKEVNLFDNPDSDGQPVIRSTTPTPLNILSIVMKGTGNR